MEASDPTFEALKERRNCLIPIGTRAKFRMGYSHDYHVVVLGHCYAGQSFYRLAEELGYGEQTLTYQNRVRSDRYVIVQEPHFEWQTRPGYLPSLQAMSALKFHRTMLALELPPGTNLLIPSVTFNPPKEEDMPIPVVTAWKSGVPGDETLYPSAEIAQRVYREYEQAVQEQTAREQQEALKRFMSDPAAQRDFLMSELNRVLKIESRAHPVRLIGDAAALEQAYLKVKAVL